ncbi:MAG: OmpA family protein [Alphaproteobacteria bacterium]
MVAAALILAYASQTAAQSGRPASASTGEWPSVDVNLNAIDEAYGARIRGRSAAELRPVQLNPPRAVRRAQSLERDATTNPLIVPPAGHRSHPAQAKTGAARDDRQPARWQIDRTATDRFAQHNAIDRARAVAGQAPSSRATIPTIPAAPRIAAQHHRAQHRGSRKLPAIEASPGGDGPTAGRTGKRTRHPAPRARGGRGAGRAPGTGTGSGTGTKSAQAQRQAAPSAPAPTAVPAPRATPGPGSAAAPAAAPRASTPAATPAPAPAPTQEAARPSPTKRLGVGDQVRVPFAKGQSELTDDARAPLKALVDTLNADAKLRVELQAFADGTADTASQARRLSLSRALAIRSYLIEQGLVSTRMDVRALGNRFESGPPDRVDVVISER